MPFVAVCVFIATLSNIPSLNTPCKYAHGIVYIRESQHALLYAHVIVYIRELQSGCLYVEVSKLHDVTLHFDQFSTKATKAKIGQTSNFNILRPSDLQLLGDHLNLSLISL